MRRRCFAITCLCGSHTGVHLKDFILSKVKELKIKVPAMTTDGATNIQLAVELLGYDWVWCIAHLLNLAVSGLLFFFGRLCLCFLSVY
jgi:nitroreductase